MTNLTLPGNNVTADSFDSNDPYHSTWQTNYTFRRTNFYGYYPTNPSSLTSIAAPDYTTEPYMRKDNAYIESVGSMSVGNLDICGYLGSGSGVPSIGPNGAVGDNVNWIGTGTTCDPRTPANSGIQPGHLNTSFNVALPDVKLPTNSWTTAPIRSGAQRITYGTTNVDPNAPYLFSYVITNGAYGGTTNYTISAQVSDSVLIKGTNINLYLPAGLNFHGAIATVWIDTNSDVKIYTAGLIDTSGGGSINNITRYAPAFRIYGLPGCTQIIFGGQPVLTTFVYTPEAEVDLAGGGGSNYYDFVGALYGNGIKMTSNLNLHYDEAITLQGLCPKLITKSPTNRVVNPGSNVTFTVEMSQGSPVTCCWYFNQTNLLFTRSNLAANVTNASFTVTNAQVTNAGNYTVVLSNALFTSITSSIATLLVGSPPMITAQPTNQTVTIGSTATFSVAVTGDGPLTYQWFKGTNVVSNGTNAIVTTNSVLTLPNVQTNRAGTYSVTVSSAFGSTNSAGALLTVMPGNLPVIIVQPTNLFVHAGGTAIFSVTVTGTPPFSYQWFSYKWAGPWFETGTTNVPIWTINSVQSINTGIYHVIVTDAFGSVTSSWAHLVIYTNFPTIDIANTFTQGNFQFHITGEPELYYAVQSSTNFVNWVPLYTNVSSFYFTDVTSNLFPYRFYRVAILPSPPFER